MHLLLGISLLIVILLTKLTYRVRKQYIQIMLIRRSQQELLLYVDKIIIQLNQKIDDYEKQKNS